MFMILLNLAAAVFASTIYAIVTIGWVRRGCKLLAGLNALVTAGAAATALGYAWLLLDPTGRPGLPLVGLVFLLPAITRSIELQREERRDAYARSLGKNLRNLDAEEQDADNE